MRAMRITLVCMMWISWTYGQPVGNSDNIATSPAPAEAISNATEFTNGNLSQQARSGYAGATICVFTMAGGASSSTASQVRAASIDSGSSGVGLSQANITCSGPRVTLQGGPSLEPYAANFKGVDYVKNVQLPGSTMTFRNVSMIIQDSSFSGLQSFGMGALVFAASNITLLNATFVNNNNSQSGCIYTNESTRVTILDSNFTSNGGLSAGAVALWNSSLVVNNTVFANNSAISQGGALFSNNATVNVIQYSTFTKNSATNGGAVYLETCNTSELQQNTFLGNSVNKSGGALFQLKCPSSLSQNTFQKNTAQNGAAIWHNNMKRLNHTLNFFMENTALQGSGGLEMNQIGNITVDQCNFTLNRGVKGGALYLQDTTGDVTNNYFGQNQVTTNGGAVFAGTSTGSLLRNVFQNNSANLDGGAVYQSHVAGDVIRNAFALPSAGNNIKGVFRTVCSGSVSDNMGLTSDAYTNQQPVTGRKLLNTL